MNKKNFVFSALDVVLLTLVAVCILSTVFQKQIHRFLGQEEMDAVEITFLVENVTDAARNHPKSGETVTFAETAVELGTLVSVTENKSVYESLSEPEETMEVMTLTCKLSAEAVQEESGYRIGDEVLKPGAQLSVQTPTSSFVMIVTMVKPIENNE